ncbi:MAG: hypothetical protein U0452_06295 [Anaerolineae bacterium]
MRSGDMSPILLRAAAIALLVGGVGWGLVGLMGGWLSAGSFGLTESQVRALVQPFLVLLILGTPGLYFGLRHGPGYLLAGGTVLAEVGLVLALLGTAATYGLTGCGGDPNGQTLIGIGTVVIGAGALVMSLGLIRQGGVAEWIPILFAALGLSVIPALLEPRLAILPGLCWAALGFTVWIASDEMEAEVRKRS